MNIYFGIILSFCTRKTSNCSIYTMFCSTFKAIYSGLNFTPILRAWPVVQLIFLQIGLGAIFGRLQAPLMCRVKPNRLLKSQTQTKQLTDYSDIRMHVYPNCNIINAKLGLFLCYLFTPNPQNQSWNFAKQFVKGTENTKMNDRYPTPPTTN